MAQSVEVVERHIEELRAALRRAVVAGDRALAATLRGELRAAERDWERSLAALAAAPQPVRATGVPGPSAGSPGPAASDPGPAVPAASGHGTAVPAASGLGRAVPAPRLVPIREQVQHALTLLSVPAAPKLIAEVHTAFFGRTVGGLTGAKLTHLRRDEERSFRAAPYARPYYLCPALTAGQLAPARGLLAVSTWALPRRMIGPLSHRVDFLTAAASIAVQAARMPDNDGVARLLRRFAVNIPGAAESVDDAIAVAEAARAELKLHVDTDRADREAAAERVRAELGDVARLFGNRTSLRQPA